MTKKEKGFIPVMLTPFKENGAIDFDGLTALTEFYLESGAAGLFANCLSSEMFELTGAERLQLVDHVCRVAKGRVPVVATGSFGDTVAEQADFVKKIYDKGADAVIVITSLMAKASETDELFDENMFKLLSLTEEIPLGFYECPEPYKRVLSPERLGKYADTGRIIYHKDTCLDLESVRQKNLACLGNKDFGLYDAYMAHAVESLNAGSAGLSCIQGNFFPELVVWLCKNYHRTDLEEEVRVVQQFFRDEMDVMHHVYPIIAKYFLQKQGLKMSTFTRRNHVGVFTNEIRTEIDALSERYLKLKEQLSIAALI
jgi:4-hydroxy-tetrahydrodipicolinate synthase